MSLLLCLLTTFLAVGQPVQSQGQFHLGESLHLDSGVIGQALVPPDSLCLQLDATTFLRDAEFFMPETKGYTATGFRLTPTLLYGINSHAQLRGGIRLTGVAGYDGLWKCEPIVAIDYSPWRWMQLTVGSLDGTWGHSLQAPMYDPERWFYDYTEQGVELRTNTAIWESDTWLNWEHYLVPWTSDQERFTLGSHHQFSLFYFRTHIEGDSPRETVLRITTPIAFLGSHRGGQFSTLDTCIETLFNESVGLQADLRWRNNQIIIESDWYFYQNQSPSGERYTPYEDGNAFYPQLTWSHDTQPHNAHTAHISLSAGYFHGHQYISPRGSYLFQSVSWCDPTFQQPERHLLTSSLELSQHYAGGFAAILEAHFYYDLDIRQLDFVVGLQLQLQQRHYIPLRQARTS